MHATKLIKVGDYGTEAVTVTSRELTLHGQAGRRLRSARLTAGWRSARRHSASSRARSRQCMSPSTLPRVLRQLTLLAVFTALGKTAATGHSGGTVGGEVASQLVVRATVRGTAPRCGHQPKAVAPGHSGLTSFDMTVGGLLLLVVVLVTAATLLGRRHGRHA